MATRPPAQPPAAAQTALPAANAHAQDEAEVGECPEGGGQARRDGPGHGPSAGQITRNQAFGAEREGG